MEKIFSKQEIIDQLEVQCSKNIFFKKNWEEFNRELKKQADQLKS